MIEKDGLIDSVVSFKSITGEEMKVEVSTKKAEGEGEGEEEEEVNEKENEKETSKFNDVIGMKNYCTSNVVDKKNYKKYADNNDDREGKEEQLNCNKVFMIRKLHEHNENRNNDSVVNGNMGSKHSKEEFHKCDKSPIENEFKITIASSYQDDFEYVDGNEGRSINKNESGSKNGNEEMHNDTQRDKKREGRRRTRVEGAIMKWSAIGSLNWDILFLLGGGFALSEGFQVEYVRISCQYLL